MSERVIDRFEIVEIDRQQGDILIFTAVRDFLRDAVLERVTIGEAGQHVMLGHMLQSFLRLDPARHIGADAKIAANLAGLAVTRGCRQRNEVTGPVGIMKDRQDIGIGPHFLQGAEHFLHLALVELDHAQVMLSHNLVQIRCDRLHQPATRGSDIAFEIGFPVQVSGKISQMRELASSDFLGFAQLLVLSQDQGQKHAGDHKYNR